MCAQDAFVVEMEKRKEKRATCLPQLYVIKRTIKICVRFATEFFVSCLYFSYSDLKHKLSILGNAIIGKLPNLYALQCTF